MKKYQNTILISIYLVALTLMWGCDKDEKIVGISKVYIPQASMADGGLTHNYPVPFNNNALTSNYFVDEENFLNVILGVHCSGLNDAQAFDVDLSLNERAATDAAAGINRGIVLASSYCSLPTTVSVDAGVREAMFYLKVDLDKIAEENPSFAKKKLVVSVTISNPAKYELNENLSTVNLVIDGEKFLPAPIIKIVKGGDFGDDSKAFWTYDGVNSTDGDGFFAIKDGVITGGWEAAKRECWIYQEITLEKGKPYILSAEVACTGTDDSGIEIALSIAPFIPKSGSHYNYKTGAEGGDGRYFFCDLDTWQKRGLLYSGGSGTFPQNSTWSFGIDQMTGEFIAQESTCYIIVFISSPWDPRTTGTITFDNIEIKEK